MTTNHKLHFEIAEWNSFLGKIGWLLSKLGGKQHWKLYRVGTVHGQWIATETAYEILSISNNEPGNGHLDDVFEWFEYSCKRDKKDLIIREFWNNDFKEHCIKKRGFKLYGENDLIKCYTQKLYLPVVGRN